MKMEENKYTFPEPTKFKCLDYTDRFSGVPAYEINRWFKQCIADKPHVQGREVMRFAIDMENWYIRWFMQFMIVGSKQS